MPRQARSAIAASDDFPTPPEEGLSFDTGDIEVVQQTDRLDEKLKTAKFMEEKVQIIVEVGTGENDPIFIELGHNGINQMVQRGVPQVIKRKFLYSALAAKRVTVANQFGLRDNSHFNKLSPSATSAYRVQLIGDNNPEGGAQWMRKVMAETTGLTSA